MACPIKVRRKQQNHPSRRAVANGAIGIEHFFGICDGWVAPLVDGKLAGPFPSHHKERVAACDHAPADASHPTEGN